MGKLGFVHDTSIFTKEVYTHKYIQIFSKTLCVSYLSGWFLLCIFMFICCLDHLFLFEQYLNFKKGKIEDNTSWDHKKILFFKKLYYPLKHGVWVLYDNNSQAKFGTIGKKNCHCVSDSVCLVYLPKILEIYLFIFSWGNI